MSTLSDEINAIFRNYAIANETQQVVSASELAPGLISMKNYYEDRLVVLLRRCYRQLAGSVMPTTGDDLFKLTAPLVGPGLLSFYTSIFTDGVLIGQQRELMIQMAEHFNTMDELFRMGSFRVISDKMANGFLGDADVKDLFKDYLWRCSEAFFAMAGCHDDKKFNPSSVWDLWRMIGESSSLSAYLAGHQLGMSWAEKDVLDGIAIATQEQPHDD